MDPQMPERERESIVDNALKSHLLPEVVDRDLKITDRARYVLARQLIAELLIELSAHRVLADLVDALRKDPTFENMQKVEAQLDRIMGLGKPMTGEESDEQPLFFSATRVIRGKFFHERT